MSPNSIASASTDRITYSSSVTPFLSKIKKKILIASYNHPMSYLFHKHLQNNYHLFYPDDVHPLQTKAWLVFLAEMWSPRFPGLDPGSNGTQAQCEPLSLLMPGHHNFVSQFILRSNLPPFSDSHQG